MTIYNQKWGNRTEATKNDEYWVRYGIDAWNQSWKAKMTMEKRICETDGF